MDVDIAVLVDLLHCIALIHLGPVSRRCTGMAPHLYAVMLLRGCPTTEGLALKPAQLGKKSLSHALALAYIVEGIQVQERLHEDDEAAIHSRLMSEAQVRIVQSQLIH